MVLLFPKDRLHRSDPLVSSGRTGAGDSVYVIYDDASHVRFGFDDWARSTAVTEPVPIDYDAPHDLQISMGSLFPELTDDFNWEGLPLSGRVQAKAEVRVVLDGTVVLSKAYPTFASTPTEVSVGANGIGTSTSDSSFYGKILFADRQGSMGGK
jgi:hypothetical protein